MRWTSTDAPAAPSADDHPNPTVVPLPRQTTKESQMSERRIYIFCPRCGMPVRIDITVCTIGFDPFSGGRITATVTASPSLHKCPSDDQGATNE